jgi:hypothetical protein
VLLVKATVQDVATGDELKDMWRDFASWIEAQEPTTWAYRKRIGGVRKRAEGVGGLVLKSCTSKTAQPQDMNNILGDRGRGKREEPERIAEF